LSSDLSRNLGLVFGSLILEGIGLIQLYMQSWELFSALGGYSCRTVYVVFQPYHLSLSPPSLSPPSLSLYHHSLHHLSLSTISLSLSLTLPLSLSLSLTLFLM